MVHTGEAVSDEDRNGSGVTGDVQLEALQVPPPSIMSAPEVADSSKDIEENTPGKRQIASQSAPFPHLTFMNSAEIIQRPAIVPPAAPNKCKARVVPKEEAVAESGVTDGSDLEALKVCPSSTLLFIKFTMLVRTSGGRLYPIKSGIWRCVAHCDLYHVRNPR